MEPDEALAAAFTQTVEHTMYFTQTAERLLGAMGQLTRTAELVAAVEDPEDSELTPELHAALVAIKTAADALGRAHTTLGRNSELRLAKIRERHISVLTTEGGPS